MSSIALLVGANPEKCIDGPVVRLIPGLYNLSIEGHINSVLILDTPDCARNIFDMLQYTVHVAHDVQVRFLKRGTESFINIFAHRAE